MLTATTVRLFGMTGWRHSWLLCSPVFSWAPSLAAFWPTASDAARSLRTRYCFIPPPTSPWPFSPWRTDCFFWRFMAGLGIGVELVTIGTYISELVPKHIRGRAFACEQAVGFMAVPVVAFLSYWLVPHKPLGLDGWRWVVILGAQGAVFVWFIRRALPESPRWLAQKGRLRGSRSGALAAGGDRHPGDWPPPACSGCGRILNPSRQGTHFLTSGRRPTASAP